MSLSLKAELEAWASALTAYDAEDFQKALELFEPISDTSRIATNIGLILATVGEHERAVECFRRATELDNYLAIAYFQGGVSSFLLGNFEEAFDQFEDALMWLRGNQAINYEQLGLNFRLYNAEIIFNRGLCLLNMGRVDEGLQDLWSSQKEKVTPEHDVIDDAVREQGEGYTVFSIPVGVLFRPNPNKIRNLQAKDYLGKARLITNDGSKYETFDGVDPDQLAFRRDRMRAGGTSDPGRRPEPPASADDAGANLGRSSSDIGGASAPRNPAGLSRAATTAVNGRGVGVEPRREPERLARAVTTTVRPLRVQSPRSMSPEPIAPEPIAPAPTRGLSMRRPLGAMKQPVGGGDAADARVPEVYDAYAGRSPPVPSQPANVSDWVDATVPGVPISRAPSRSASVMRSQTSYPSRSPSQHTMRRAPSRKGTMRSRSGRRSFEEEEGYVSGGGEFDEVTFEVTKIRVKLHFKKDLRGMAILPDISCDEFMDRVCAKFGREYGDLSLKFSDEDGAQITLIDESDFELAIETARAAALKGKESRLEIWCEELGA